MKILVADDDPQIVRALRVILRAHGYEVAVATDGQQALDVAVREPPDLLLLDLGLPGLSGLAVIASLRIWSRVPILVVSGRTETADKVDALDLGATDYVTKPFVPDELLARIRAHTRGGGREAPDEPVVEFGDVRVDLAAKQVLRAGEPVRLTPTEWSVLERLVRSPRRLITQQALLNDVWGAGHARDTGYLRIYLGQLRRKLEPDPSRPRHLVTEPGIGYRFIPD